jgi:PAS domain S-box-containing protein
MQTARNRRVANRVRLFWAALLLMVFVSGVSFLTTNQLVKAYSDSSRSHEALLELEQFLSSLKDVETGVRGYALTGDRRFLEPYEAGRISVRKSLAELKTLEASGILVKPGLGNLDQLAERRLSSARQVVDRTATGAGKQAIIATAGSGRLAMDHVRARIASISTAQRAAYAERRSGVGRQAVIANLALAAGMAVGLLILWWLFSLLDGQIKRRRVAEQDLRDLNSNLELRVHARTAEVQETRRLLDAVIENIPDAVFLKDSANDFKYILINKAGEKLGGHGRDEFIGHVDHELFPTDVATRHRNDDQEVVRSGKMLFVPSSTMATNYGTRVIETCKVPVQVDGDGTRYVLGIVRDLTDQKELETQVREMQRLESVGRLTGGIAHDFNNLLAIIMGSVELIREDLTPNSEAFTISSEALEAVTRGADLVRRLLAFARKQHLEPTPVDLNERLPTIVPLIERTLGENIRVRMNAAADLWRAQIDPTQVDDALVNLSINARDAMPEGGALVIETANVVLDSDYAAHHAEVEPGEYVMLAVSDTGAGMTPDTIARAFEPFFTTKGEGKGTGLGLSQVYGWVKQSGGHIKIYSELDHGTTIKLYLPRAQTGSLPAAPSRLHEPVTRGHEKILLVEDNPNVRRTVIRQLTQLGYVTIEAEDGEAAFAMVERGLEFDLLLTDVVMPGGMNGYELAEKVKEARPGARILFTSGYTELAEANRDMSRIGPLISKPYSRQDLGRAIRAALGDKV